MLEPILFLMKLTVLIIFALDIVSSSYIRHTVLEILAHVPLHENSSSSSSLHPTQSWFRYGMTDGCVACIRCCPKGCFVYYFAQPRYSSLFLVVKFHMAGDFSRKAPHITGSLTPNGNGRGIFGLHFSWGAVSLDIFFRECPPMFDETG